MPRTRSTQKLPISAPLERARPRTSATATASPTAGETKFWTVSPSVWTSGDVPDSPAYDCQFVLVTNETAVLSAVSRFIDGAAGERQDALQGDEREEQDDADDGEPEDGDGIRASSAARMLGRRGTRR